MGIRDWIVEKLNPAQAGIATTEPSPDPINIASFQEAFQNIEIIHRSIELIINAAVGMPFKIEGGTSKKIHKLLNVRPNPFEDRNRFFRRALLDYYLDGNVFIFVDPNMPGTALFIIPANDMSVIPDKKTFVAGYEYAPLSHDDSPGFLSSIISGRTSPKDSEISKPIIFGPNEIIHIKTDNQDSIYRGEPKLQNLEKLIELYYSMIEFQGQFFKNNAIPGLVLQTDNVLSKPVKARLLSEWSQSYNSIMNGAKSPAILDGGLKIDKFSSINFHELDFENSIERIQQDMAKALGVPYILLKSGNNANISQNQVLLYVNTIIPVLQSFASAFEHFFADSTIVPDKTSVEALRPDIKAQAAYWSTLVNGGIATPNEARKGLRLEEINDEECNSIRVPQNIAGSAVNPDTGGRPTIPADDDS